MPADESDRVSTLISQVRGFARLMVDELTDRLHAAGYRDITAAQYVVFESLDPEGTRLTTLAERAGITRQSLTELVSALERNGYLEVAPDPDDRRARRVRMTTRGRALVRRAIEEIAALEAGWQESFSRAGMDGNLRDLLHDAIDEHGALGRVEARPASGRPEPSPRERA